LLTIPEDFRNTRYINLTTFRKNGEKVLTTVLFGTDGDRILVHTGADSGKVKRIRNNGRVLVQPSNIFGKPAGREYGANARVLSKHEKNSAKKTVSRCCLEKWLSYIFHDIILKKQSEILEIQLDLDVTHQNM